MNTCSVFSSLPSINLPLDLPWKLMILVYIMHTTGLFIKKNGFTTFDDLTISAIHSMRSQCNYQESKPKCHLQINAYRSTPLKNLTKHFLNTE